MFIGVILCSAIHCAESADATVHQIDLPTALQLAGAQNLDVQIARERLNEARATHDRALNQFFPWISPGLAYRRHDGRIQDVSGNVFNASKQSYTAGGTLGAQWEIGDAWYQSLATRQLARAADHALEAQTLETTYNAAAGYLELAKARSLVGVANEAVRLSTEFADQVDRAVSAGIAFKGDALRARVQAERNQLAIRQAQELQRIAGVRLAQVLRLDPAVELQPQETDFAPLTLVATNRGLDSLVAEALHSRPEFKQHDSLLAAAKDSRDGAVYGPLIPSLGAQAYVGGLGGGRNGSWGNFGDTEDVTVGLSWRIGPGGIFDKARIRQADARTATVRLNADKLHDQVIGQVVEAQTRMLSLSDQIAVAQRALTAAEATLRLTRERKEFAVGVVLENLQAEQELTKSRNDYLTVVAEYSKAQYALSRAIGSLGAGGSAKGRAPSQNPPK